MVRDGLCARPGSQSSMLLGIFAGMALVLAAMGLYGVISYTVRRIVYDPAACCWHGWSSPC